VCNLHVSEGLSISVRRLRRGPHTEDELVLPWRRLVVVGSVELIEASFGGEVGKICSCVVVEVRKHESTNDYRIWK
jgi:hypothetical protein